MKRFYLIIPAVLLMLWAVPAFATFPASSTIANQAKVEMLSGKIRIGDTFKAALYTQAGANYSASSGSYSTTGELSTANGYTQGGSTLASCAVTLNSSTAQFTCTSPAWTLSGGSITADAVVIYDASCGTNSCTNANQVILMAPFTSTTATGAGSSFTVTLPATTITLQ